MMFLFRGRAGDHYVSQCACELNYLEQIFTVYPDYLDSSEYENLSKKIMRRNVKS